MSKCKIISETPDDLVAASRTLLGLCGERKVVAFFGELGAGKTTFIKAVCNYLGVGNETSSPSFALINEYRTFVGEKIYHFDFYRVKDEAEAYDLGYEDYFYSGDYCFIEWPEKILNLLPPEYVKVEIGAKDNQRTIQIQT